MAQKTDSQLGVLAQQVADETAPGANTADRVGNLFQDFVDSKQNNDNPKVYAASFSQSGSGAPTKVEYKNTIGAIVWTYSSTGVYLGTLVGAFPSGKVPKLQGFIRQGSSIGSTTLNTFEITRISDDVIALGTKTNGAAADGLLVAEFYEIKVYP